jgi:hypothetical protein
MNIKNVKLRKTIHPTTKAVGWWFFLPTTKKNWKRVSQKSERPLFFVAAPQLNILLAVFACARRHACLRQPP